MGFGSASMSVTQYEKHKNYINEQNRKGRIVIHTDPPPEVQAECKRLEKSLTNWIKHHGGEAFDQPFSPDHKRVIAKIETAINKGGLFALAMPRGHGKTTILKWVTLYCMLTGRRSYVVVVAATAEMAQALIEFCRQQIQESETLHEHYPHVTTYARDTGGKAIKARYQLRADGKSSGIQWSKTTLVFPEVLDKDGGDYPSNGAILEGYGLTGAIRGKWKDTKTGRVIRPDFVLMDDPQTRESAESESQCNMRERIITGDVLGLAGPRKKIAAVMPCTIIRRGDLAARFLDHERHPEWNGEICQLVDKWPDAQETYWREYAGLYREGMANNQGGKAATAFYKANRKAMDKGAKVSWKERVREGELSAIQTAENLLIETGDQFGAEYQNEPIQSGVTVYTLTAENILKRTDPDRQPGEVPEWAQIIVGATDVNRSYALTTAVTAFGKDQRAAVLWYGTAKMNVNEDTTDAQKKAEIYAALASHGRVLAGMPCRPQSWFIDGGGSPKNTVIDFATSSPRICGLQAFCAFGRAGKTFKINSKYQSKQFEEAVLIRENVARQWLLWNAHYWMEQAQRGWVGDIGAPGSCSLPVGQHREFAEQICREILRGKTEETGRMIWDWDHAPGAHDFADSMAMCYMGAAVAGIGTGGGPVRRRKYVEKRKCKIQRAE